MHNIRLGKQWIACIPATHTINENTKMIKNGILSWCKCQHHGIIVYGYVGAFKGYNHHHQQCLWTAWFFFYYFWCDFQPSMVNELFWCAKSLSLSKLLHSSVYSSTWERMECLTCLKLSSKEIITYNTQANSVNFKYVKCNVFY